MWLFDFQAKLTRLNKGLYVDLTQKRAISPDNYSVAVCRTYGSRQKRNMNDHYVSNEAQAYLNRVNSGETEYLGGISYPEVGEFDTFNHENNTILRKGWRSFLLHLVQKKICSLEEARRAFNCQSLGTTKYDKASYEQKLAWSRET
jgi:hypothetical protein